MKLFCQRIMLVVVLLTIWIPFSAMTTSAQECFGGEFFDVMLLEEDEAGSLWAQVEALFTQLQSTTITAEEAAQNFERINALQIRWWTELAPNLSQCERLD